jgi:hypothetical protein
LSCKNGILDRRCFGDDGTGENPLLLALDIPVYYEEPTTMKKHMFRILISGCAVFALLASIGHTSADLVPAGVNWEANDDTATGSNPERSFFDVTIAEDGNDIVYSWTKTADLDGLANTNDTLSFDLRYEAFTGSSFSSQDLTLGT